MSHPCNRRTYKFRTPRASRRSLYTYIHTFAQGHKKQTRRRKVTSSSSQVARRETKARCRRKGRLGHITTRPRRIFAVGIYKPPAREEGVKREGERASRPARESVSQSVENDASPRTDCAEALLRTRTHILVKLPRAFLISRARVYTRVCAKVTFTFAASSRCMSMYRRRAKTESCEWPYSVQYLFIGESDIDTAAGGTGRFPSTHVLQLYTRMRREFPAARSLVRTREPTNFTVCTYMLLLLSLLLFLGSRSAADWRGECESTPAKLSIMRSAATATSPDRCYLNILSAPPHHLLMRYKLFLNRHLNHFC